MSRLSITVLASLVLVPAVASADTFGGWQYTAPPGYTPEIGAHQAAFTKLAKSSFCSISLFEARTFDRPATAGIAIEWTNIVTHTFDAKVRRRANLETDAGIDVAATTATLEDRAGNKYAGVHYVVMPPGMIGSVLLIAPTPKALRSCEPAASAFLGTLAIDWTSPRFHDPEARVETPQGRWATAGPTSREYTFRANGTYRFHSEATEGKRVRVRDEAGSYKVLGNQLTLTPRNVTLAVIVQGVGKVSAGKLTKTTYTWGKRYIVDSNEWQLVLTPRKAKKGTERDGRLPAHDNGYRYSDHTKPAWKFAPHAGV